MACGDYVALKRGHVTSTPWHNLHRENLSNRLFTGNLRNSCLILQISTLSIVVYWIIGCDNHGLIFSSNAGSCNHVLVFALLIYWIVSTWTLYPYFKCWLDGPYAINLCIWNNVLNSNNVTCFLEQNWRIQTNASQRPSNGESVFFKNDNFYFKWRI